MAHKDRNTNQHRVWLRRETVKQIKAMALILDKDWNIVLDDVCLAGVAYLNEVGKMELSDWDGRLNLVRLDSDLPIRIVTGTLPMPGEST